MDPQIVPKETQIYIHYAGILDFHLYYHSKMLRAAQIPAVEKNSLEQNYNQPKNSSFQDSNC